ncbi:MAG TPA: Hsp20 family protein [Candidatus Acidoferrales bacterium]|nr:Hsp20 family protein [Candidatus Acidoferrales bacterium]
MASPSPSTAAATAPETRSVKTTEALARTTSQIEDVFAHFDRIYEKLARRAFEIFSNNGKGFGHDLENWLQAESELLHPVHVEMTEQDGAVNVRAEVPGFEAKDLEIKLEPSRVTIGGKRETKGEHKNSKTIYHEHCANEILRVVDLPAEVATTKAEAKLKNGILEIHAPKGAAQKTARVPIKAS